MTRRTGESKKAPKRRRVDWVERGVASVERLQPALGEKTEEPALISWLSVVAAERGMTLQQLALELGVTYGYIAQLRSGARSLANVSDDFVDCAAEMLGLPRISILAACGRIKLKDFYRGRGLTNEIDAAYAFVRRHEVWGAVMPASIQELDQEGRLFVVRLFEAATGTVLIPEFDQTPAA